VSLLSLLRFPNQKVSLFQLHSNGLKAYLGKGSLIVHDISNYECITDDCTVNQCAGNNDHGCVAIKATVLMEHMCVSGIICCGLLWYGNVCGFIRPPPLCHHMSPLISFWQLWYILYDVQILERIFLKQRIQSMLYWPLWKTSSFMTKLEGHSWSADHCSWPIVFLLSFRQTNTQTKPKTWPPCQMLKCDLQPYMLAIIRWDQEEKVKQVWPASRNKNRGVLQLHSWLQHVGVCLPYCYCYTLLYLHFYNLFLSSILSTNLSTPYLHPSFCLHLSRLEMHS